MEGNVKMLETNQYVKFIFVIKKNKQTKKLSSHEEAAEHVPQE